MYSVAKYVSQTEGDTTECTADACQIQTYGLNELLATKFRALYQRSKGRDLFDLAVALDDPASDPEAIVEIFARYMDLGGHHVTRTQFEANLHAKRNNPNFATDIGPLLSADFGWDFEKMVEKVLEGLT